MNWIDSGVSLSHACFDSSARDCEIFVKVEMSTIVDLNFIFFLYRPAARRCGRQSRYVLIMITDCLARWSACLIFRP